MAQPSHPVREYCRQRGFSERVCNEGLDYLLGTWKQTVREILEGYILGGHRGLFDEFLNDMDGRRSRAGCHSPLSGTVPGSMQENYPVKQCFSKVWNTDVVTNITRRTLTLFMPSPELKNGTAVVICPGGGFMAMSIASEGTDVAKYLTAKSVTAFVLKYRLPHTGEDATQEFGQLFADRQKSDEML
jgi:acetyl esterase/lipase